KEGADTLGIGAIEKRGVGGDAKTALDGFVNAFDGLLVAAFAANGEIVMFALAVHVNRKRQVLAWPEKMEFFLKQQRIRAEVDVLLPGHKARNDFVDLRMHERFSARNRNHGRTALVDGLEAFLGGELLFQDVRGILDFSAPGAGQVATEQRLQHENE